MCIIKTYFLLFILFCGLAICTSKKLNKEYPINLTDKDNVSLIDEQEKINEETEQNAIIEMVSSEDSNLMNEYTIQWKFKKYIVLANQ